MSHKFRFSSTSATTTAVNSLSIGSAMGAVCTVANTTVTNIFNSFKIGSIEIFAPPASQGSNSTCSVEWTGSPNQPSVEISDTSNSTATPAYIKTIPPPGSQAAFWQYPGAGGGSICNVTAPVGSIIDLVVTGILFDDENSATTTAIATGTLGNMYYLSLDPNATHRYVPISLTTTT